MTRPDDAVPGSTPDDPATPARTWTWPRHLGRMRTSTVLLVLAFLATALLRGFFIGQDAQKAEETTGGGEVPAVTTSQQVPQQPSTTVHPTTTSVPPTSSATVVPETTGTAPTTATPATSPLIVLPSGLVPSGVELPPGVVVETTTTAPASTTP